MSLTLPSMHAELKRNYLDAFKAANPNSALPWLEFHAGWWKIGYGSIMRPSRLRTSKLEEMTQRLRERASACSEPPINREK